MITKRAFAYFDDTETTVDAFRKTVRHVWHLPHDVLSNCRFGKIDDSSYDAFEGEICETIQKNLERLDCVFLDLDFSGNVEGAEERNLVGFRLGQTIRRRWPQLPIIIVSRFTEVEMVHTGLILDFDDIREGIALTQMDIPAFNGMVERARKKRQNLLESFGDVPVSFLTGKHKYFHRTPVRTSEAGKYAFVAMSFDESIVPNDVWELGIKGALSEVSLQAVRVDFDPTSRAIVDKIATYIFDSTFVVADLTAWNANVLYELGLAHASNKDCILICNEGSDAPLAFDVRHLRVIKYKTSEVTRLKADLLASARSLLDSPD